MNIIHLIQSEDTTAAIPIDQFPLETSYSSPQNPLDQTLPLPQRPLKRSITDISGREPPAQGTRRRAVHACERCRERKSKCDSERPSCGSCIRYRALCEYKNVPLETVYGIGQVLLMVGLIRLRQCCMSCSRKLTGMLGNWGGSSKGRISRPHNPMRCPIPRGWSFTCPKGDVVVWNALCLFRLCAHCWGKARKLWSATVVPNGN
jgi:Fungal Zn(2)-Cys(6) binuclear cluster domain